MAICWSRMASVRSCPMLTKAGNGECPRSTKPWVDGYLAVVEGDRTAPRDPFFRDLTAADVVPDVEDVALLTDRLRADRVAFGSRVDHDARNAPLGQQQGGDGLADRPGAEHEDPSARLEGRCRHGRRPGGVCSWSAPLPVGAWAVSPAAWPRPRGRVPRSRSGASRRPRTRPTGAARQTARSARRSATCRTWAPARRESPRTPP